MQPLCIGMHWALTAHALRRLDLRYIPQTQSFEGRTPRDEAFQVSVGALQGASAVSLMPRPSLKLRACCSVLVR